MTTTIFLILISLVVYNHIVYPLFLKLVKENKESNNGSVSIDYEKKVAVVVSAFNEERFIEEKILNFKSLNYKNKKLFIYNDGSKDETFDILKKYKHENNIFIFNKVKNRGKVDSINSYIKKYSMDFDYTIFTDASSSFDSDFIERMVFKIEEKENISVVSSSYIPHKDSPDQKYWVYQRKIKSKEECLGNVLGVHGSGYMIKNSYLEVLDVNIINDDFVIPSKTIKKDGKVVYSNIPSYELENDNKKGLNFIRRVRIGAGNMQQIFSCFYLFNIFKRPLTAFNFFSIKVLRTFMPIILLSIILLTPFVENEFIMKMSTVFFSFLIIYIVLMLYFKELQSKKVFNLPLYVLKSYYYSGVGIYYYLIAKRIGGWYDPLYSKRLAFVKRTIDVLFSILLLSLSTPILLISIFFLKIENFKAPVFFKQTRVGIIKDGKQHYFKVIKLRSMIVDAEKDTGAVFATKNDPRVTKVGRILRKFRIDEIPQFFNVLRGDMSLVGPRPERPEIMEKIKYEVPYFYKRTENIKPGITGLAQVRSGYNETFADLKEKYEIDKEYKEKSNESILEIIYTDIKIMFSTISVVLLMKGL
tara:strand:- start:36707 stop:38464 length:1758 start_codon:yes stop_codon:yes gene_type:complete